MAGTSPAMTRSGASINDTVRENFDRIGRAPGAACRYRTDAAVDIHVLVRRRAREVHGRDLFGRAIAVAACLRGAVGAGADDLAASRGVLPPRTPLAAIAPGDSLHPRSRGVFSCGGLSAARRCHHLLPRE